MSTTIRSLFEFINNAKSLYVAPYHRAYDWDESCCKEFLDKALDMDFKMLDFGVITYQKCDDLGNYILIDGYQRLMTILLFVQALIKTSKIKFSEKNMPSNFLVSINNDGEDIFKLKINNNDKNDIEKIIKNDFCDEEIRNKNFINNYLFFEKELKQNKMSVLDLLNNISKIKIDVSILDVDNQNEEVLYFEINKNFSELDLIRNFVYKMLKESNQSHIFNTYWLAMEKMLCGLNEAFLIDYLTIQNNGLIPKKTELFDAFSAFMERMDKLKQRDDIIKHLYRYSSYYVKIVNSDIKDEDLKAKISYINSFDSNDTYSYLMEVFEDYDFAHISKHMLLDILDSITMFVKQREKNPTCPIAVNFAALSKDINKMLVLKALTPKIVVQDIKDLPEKDQLKVQKKITINDLIRNKSTG